MKINTLYKLGIAFFFLLASQSYAHHSFTAEFDSEQPISLSGIVTKVEWSNPHVWIYMNVKDEETGEVTNWGGELGPPHLLQRRGWRRNSLTVGTKVSMDGFLARNGSARLNARSVTMTETGGQPGETLDAASSRDQEN